MLPTAAVQRPQLILGIESSCDDTGVAVVSTDGRILGEAIASQACTSVHLLCTRVAVLSSSA